MQIKRFHVMTKTLVHCIVGLVEIVIIPVFIAYISTFIQPIQSEGSLWPLIERSVFCFFFYEAVLIYISKMLIDVRKDALLALITAYQRAKLGIETKSDELLNELCNRINKVTGNSNLNQVDVIKDYDNLLDYIRNENIIAINYSLIILEHEVRRIDLAWNYTLLLRLFK